MIETCEQLCWALYQAHESETFSLLDVRLAPDNVSPAPEQLSTLFAKTLKG